ETLFGSPAIGKGLVTGAPNTDERGFPRTGLTVSIGAFEPQSPLGTSPNQLFVENIYETLLHRPADPGAVVWVTQLDHALSPAAFVLAIQASTEYRTNEVQALYQRCLRRAADPGGLQAFVNFLGHGGTVEQVAAVMVGSPEYFQLHGGNNVSFLEALYLDALG